MALAAAAITGAAAAGLGAALLRRVREVIFIAIGFLIAGTFSIRSLRRAAATEAAAAELGDTQRK